MKISEVQSMKINKTHMKNNEKSQRKSGGNHMKTNETQRKLYKHAPLSGKGYSEE